MIASVVAVYGIDAWRREFRGRRRLELAEEVLALFYEARDRIAAIRNLAGFAGEGRTREPGPDEDPEHKDRLDRAYVLIERYSAHQSVFARIQALSYRFIAVFGSDAGQPFRDLNGVLNDLIGSAHRMATLSTLSDRAFRTQEDLFKHHAQMQEVDRIYYAGREDDRIRARVDRLVADTETTCRAIIESRPILSCCRRFSRKKS